MRFDELDLEDEILDGLDDMNFQEMTPVQEHTIPVILEGRDIIGCAQTGTGKTAAYTLPLLNRLLIEGNEDNVIKSVIIVPTRELAQQIDQQFQGFSYYLPMSTTVVYGGGDGKGWDVQKQRYADGFGRGDRHPRAHDLAHPEQRHRPLARRVPDPRRGRPYARHGFQRGHHEDRLLYAQGSADDHVLGDAAPEDPRDGQDDPAQSRRGEHRHFETQRGDRPVGLCLLREPEAGHHPRDVRRADRIRRRSSSRRRSSRSRSWRTRSSA